MKDNFDLQNETDWKKLANWLGVGVLCGVWWYSLVTNGFFVTIIWTIVFVATFVLWFKIRDNR